MSETANDETTPQSEDKETKNSNHVAGCGIFLVILGTVIFLASVAVYSYFDYKKVFVDMRLSEFKNTFFVTAITDEHIEARSSFKVNAGFDGERHFNGLLKLKPVIAQGSIFPIVDEAIPDTGAQVPPKILNAIPVLMFVEYRNDEEIQDVFHKLTKVELKNSSLHITSDPESTETAIIDMDVSEETNVGFQLFGLLTFIFISTVGFAVWYGKWKKKQPTN